MYLHVPLVIGMPKPAATAHRKLRCAAPAIILSVVLLYAAVIFICELPLVSRRPSPPSLRHRLPLQVKSSELNRETTKTTIKPTPPSLEVSVRRSSRRSLAVSSLSLHHLNHSSFYTTNRSDIDNDNGNRNTRVLYDLRFVAARAWAAGQKLMKELESSPASWPTNNMSTAAAVKQQSCRSTLSLVSGTPPAISLGKENANVLLELPCGLTYGSHITLVATPAPAHSERDPAIFPASSKARMGWGDEVMVSQFVMELQGLKAVDGEEPPKILHYNPRLKGDWSGKPVIEQNSCFRMTWSTPLRCEGWESGIEEDRVDGLVKCEKWLIKEDIETIKFLNQMNRKTSRIQPGWSYPFEEGKMFVLTLSAGFEGYHISVNGKHVSSFPYRLGFDVEDATGLLVTGDLDVHSIVAASLPTSHPSFAPQGHLEMSSLWQAPELPAGGGPIDLFIGVLSAGNHFLERMAARKSWMSSIRNSPNVVARFFVAMHGRKEINVELKKEAEFFGDIILVPFLDSYDLVVLKTLAITDYGLRTVSAKFIMKCDDDTFVRVDSVMDQLKFHGNRSLYIGNMNYHTKPLRRGKWAVTPEECPEEEYPPYANGPGYVISSDIAKFIVSEFEEHRLKLFKMEDVSLGMWVQQFNVSSPVKYVHSLRFCQYGCFDGYITAHYQSPKQMLCMWEKLQAGRAECCNIR